MFSIMNQMNILLAVILGLILIILEAMYYKLVYNLTIIANDSFIISLVVLQIIVLYLVLTVIGFNKIEKYTCYRKGLN